MALALTDRSVLAVHVVHDERAAAFVALGLGLDGLPAALLCTSGTAAVNFHPAVVEAFRVLFEQGRFGLPEGEAVLHDLDETMVGPRHI